MITLAYKQRRPVSSLLLVTMLLSLWTFASPQKAHAGIMDTVKKVAKTVVVQGGALTAGFFGGVVGMALGAGTIVGGPIAMVAGGVGGYMIGKKVMNWATSSTANVATVLGAVGGGLLVAGMGFPLLAVGVIGGALIGRGIAKLFSKITGKAPQAISSAELAQEETNAEAFIAHVNAKSAIDAAPVAVTTAAVVAPQAEPQDPAKDAYAKYLAAYKTYMAATQEGDSKAAQASYAEYKKYLDQYNVLLKSKSQ